MEGTFNRRLCMYRLLAIFHPSRFGLMRVRFQQPQAETILETVEDCQKWATILDPQSRLLSIDGCLWPPVMKASSDDINSVLLACLVNIGRKSIKQRDRPYSIMRSIIQHLPTDPAFQGAQESIDTFARRSILSLAYCCSLVLHAERHSENYA